ncbi:hypothetical protein [Methylobacterium brachythecii]|uniref:Uncharacterized protein n=1 Tax=Methylobacterium brachythecii TaxID=1176177 RepID=A0A7W6AP49_9HYPH|nr:hypothetical protein [Methylobacterium brachythecii]MBB3905394.1 hypothetical protein [Methylobacterium brachythecii]GLS46749.1 hypothetical protein GCM10007884_47440 [Methylobacterium brachythecii]
MTDETDPKRVTLDGQLVKHWDREAARLDDLAGRAMFKWIARGYARKADRARALAEAARARETARGRGPEPA